MDTLNIIVHQEAVELRASMGFEKAKYILSGIGNLRLVQDNLVIKIDEDPRILPGGIPPPSDDLNVIVLGAYKEYCCNYQLSALRDKGYNATYHPELVMGAEEF